MQDPNFPLGRTADAKFPLSGILEARVNENLKTCQMSPEDPLQCHPLLRDPEVASLGQV